MNTTDFRTGERHEEAAKMLALWSAVLRNAVIADGDTDYMAKSDFRYVCGLIGLDHSWVARKLRSAMAVKARGPYVSHKTRARIDEMRAHMSAGQRRAWSQRKRRERVPKGEAASLWSAVGQRQ